MCDPVTLTVAATAISAVGTITSGVAARNEARYSAGVARNNASYARNQAADAEARGQQEQIRKGREIAQVRSAQIASAAANGLDTTFGSAADVVADTNLYGLQDQSVIRENAAREATGFEISAQNYDQQGKAYDRQAKQIGLSTALSVGGTILGGAGQIKGMKAPVSSGKSAAAFAARNVPVGSIMGAFGGGI